MDMFEPTKNASSQNKTYILKPIIPIKNVFWVRQILNLVISPKKSEVTLVLFLKLPDALCKTYLPTSTIDVSHM